MPLSIKVKRSGVPLVDLSTQKFNVFIVGLFRNCF